MLERTVIALLLIVFGVVAYRVFSRRHVLKAAASAITDPLLNGLQQGVPTIVYFTTPTCMPCKTQQQPALKRLKEELGEGVQIITVDACEEPDTAARWGVFSAPTTFILDKQGQPREVNHGVADTDKLKRQLTTAIAV